MPVFTTPNPSVISTAAFQSDIFNYDPLYASETISQSAKIAGALGALKRGQVLFGPALGAPITSATLLTTATGAGAARCILAQDIDTTGGPVTGLVYTCGNFLDTAMIFTTQGALADSAMLWQFDVHVLTVLQRSGLLVPMTNLPATGGPMPQALPPKEAEKASKDQVESIKTAMEAYRPFMESIPIAGMTPGKDPAWAIAAFGEREPTPEEKAKAEEHQQQVELADKQRKEAEELLQKQQKEASELATKQAAAREQLAKQAAAKTAKPADAHAQNATHPAPKSTEKR